MAALKIFSPCARSLGRRKFETRRFCFTWATSFMVRASRSTTANASTGRIATIPARSSLWRDKVRRRQAIAECISSQFLCAISNRSRAGGRQRHLPRNHDPARRLLAARCPVRENYRLVFELLGKPGISRRRRRRGYFAASLATYEAQIDRRQKGQQGR